MHCLFSTTHDPIEAEWAFERRLLAPDQDPDSSFGGSLSSDEGTLVIGSSLDSEANYRAGTVFVLQTSGDDCNDNLFCDEIDILDGYSTDINANGVPDECEFAPGDIDRNGTVGVFDLLALLVEWGDCPAPASGKCPADFDDDGQVGVFDLLTLFINWG